jgi:CBS domain-containing protein
MIIASVSLKPLAAASISAGKLRARPSSHRRFAAQRPAGSFSAEHEARLSSHNPTGGSSSIDEASVVDPYGHVADVMSSPARTLTTGLPLEDAIVATTMERYRVSVCAFSRSENNRRCPCPCPYRQGVPVVDPETGTCVGVLSMKDLEKVGNLSGYTVEDVMSSPPRTCLQRATVASVAGMMLKHKCHRIPVVNDRDVPIGIVTRSDIFEPLLATSQDLLVNQETRR